MMKPTRLLTYVQRLSTINNLKPCYPMLSRYLTMSSSLNQIQTIQSVPSKHRSMKLDQVLSDAKRILIPETDQSSSDYNLQQLISEEVMVITQILQKLVGTNHSLSEIQKLYESESSSDHFIRGLIVLLISKAVPLPEVHQSSLDTTKTQWRLAKIVEMVHMAVLIHKQIKNVAFHQSLDSIETQQNLSNKISVLYGDFLWAKAWKELADMGDIEVIDMMVSVLVNTSEGQFLTEVESSNWVSKLNLDYWFEKNFLLTACLPAFGCRSTLKLAKIDEHLQKNAYEFGRNFGFFNKAYQEIKWFYEDRPINETIDFCSLPVIMHFTETGQSLNHLVHDNPAKTFKKIEFDHQSLFETIRNGPGLNGSRTILDNFRHKSLQNLNHFPESEAKDHLKNILEALDV